MTVAHATVQSGRGDAKVQGGGGEDSGGQEKKGGEDFKTLANQISSNPAKVLEQIDNLRVQQQANENVEKVTLADLGLTWAREVIDRDNAQVREAVERSVYMSLNLIFALH